MPPFGFVSPLLIAASLSLQHAAGQPNPGNPRNGAFAFLAPFLSEFAKYAAKLASARADGFFNAKPREKTKIQFRVLCPGSFQPSMFTTKLIDLYNETEWNVLTDAHGRKECKKLGWEVGVRDLWTLRQSSGSWVRDTIFELQALSDLPKLLANGERLEIELKHIRFMQDIVGIDLGTTFVSVAMLNNQACTRIKDLHDSYDYPAVATIFPNCEAQIGYHRLPNSPALSISQIKRLIGRHFDDPIVQKVRNQTRWPLEVVQRGGLVFVAHHGDRKECLFSPVDIESKLLSYAKAQVESHEGAVMQTAVVSVPVSYNHVQRTETLRAAELAGIVVARLVDEPVLATYHYLSTHQVEDGILLVIDCGGGTTDVTLMEQLQGKFKVLHKDSVDSGGVDLTQCLYEQLHEQAHDFCNTIDSEDLDRLYEQAEESKVKLSTRDKHTIRLTPSQPQCQSRILNVFRREFETWCSTVLALPLDLVKRVLKDAGMKKASIGNVLMVGGSSMIPAIRNAVEAFFGWRPMIQDPRAEVACGVALLAKRGFNDQLEDTLPYSLGTAYFNSERARELLRKAVPSVEVESMQFHELVDQVVACDMYEDPLLMRVKTILERGAAVPASGAVDAQPHKNATRVSPCVYVGESTSALASDKVACIDADGFKASRDNIYRLNFTVSKSAILTVTVIPYNFEPSAGGLQMKLPLQVLPHQLNSTDLQHLQYVHHLEKHLESLRITTISQLDLFEACNKEMKRRGFLGRSQYMEQEKNIMSLREFMSSGMNTSGQPQLNKIMEGLEDLHEALASDACQQRYP